ncbi:integron integrase [Candidatus Vecturithrix granuli]|uniref:Integron integrase n=1 Tax=Vecturithrix granuli TaxID=1499967 RepID=A0A081BZK3_VECG1|nr:integron integrase [Candidatus Vecturithrix granuli]
MDVKPKLFEQVRDRLRVLHRSYHTERQYLIWIRAYIVFCNQHEPDKAKWRHPKDCGRHELEAFLTHLAVDQHVSASTQNQALCALVFLYREVLQQPFDHLNAIRAKKPVTMPAVFSREEAVAVIELIDTDMMQTMAKLLYGSGLRLMECVRLRIKDVDFQRKQLLVRNGKGSKDRYTILLDNAIEPLQRQIAYSTALHEQDILPRDMERSICRMRWRKNIPMPQQMCAGSGYFHPEICQLIPVQASNNGIISAPLPCKRP